MAARRPARRYAGQLRPRRVQAKGYTTPRCSGETIRANLGLGDALGTPGHGEVRTAAELTPATLIRRRRPDGSG